MSAKFLCKLSDENPDLRKQLGCMNGIFQIFGRSHFLGGRIVGHTSKRIPQDEAISNGREESSGSQKPKRKSSKKVAKDNQMVPNEPSRASFSSSSCSSSFSAIGPPAFNHATFSDNPTRGSSVYQSNTSQLTRKSLDLKGVVKDSIHKDTKSLSNNADSPRPSSPTRFPNSNAASPLNTPRRAVSRTFSGRSDCSLMSAPKDSPRLSYDERELRSGNKSSMRLRELPRFSLDGRERSIRSSGADVRSNHLVKGNSNLSNGGQEPISQRSSPSVITKLMGLDMFPDPESTYHYQPERIESPRRVGGSTSRSVVTAADNKKHRLLNSPRHYNEDMAPRSPKNASPGLKPVAGSKFPVEPAPWKQPEGRKAQKLATKSQAEPPKINLSVYGEIQKRLTQIEFKKSDKDLRALKQILEAMEKTQQMLESRKGLASQTSDDVDLDPKSDQPISVSIATQASPRSIKSTFKSNIVVMKPGETLGRADVSTSAAIPKDGLKLNRIQIAKSRDWKEETARKQTDIDPTPRPNHRRGPSNRPLHPMDNSSSPRQLRKMQFPKGSDSNTRETTRSMSPGLHQKKNVQSISHPSDLSKPRGQSGRQHTEPASPSRKPRQRLRQKHDDRLSDISSDTRDLSYQSDAKSQQSESNMSLASNADYTEVTSQCRFEKIGDILEQRTPKQASPDAGYIEDGQKGEPVKLALQQLSPVSVLDPAFYDDESPSPVRKISSAFKEDDTVGYEEEGWRGEDTDSLPRFRKLETNQNVTETEEIAMDEIPICTNSIDDHEYISKILVASGLLRNLESSRITTHINQSQFPINPNLFYILEQDNTSREVSKGKHNDKIGPRQPVQQARRKLIFDGVNEMLGQKFLSEGCYTTPWFPSSMLTDEQSREQRLLRFLCSEIDRLQALNSTCTLDDEGVILDGILWEDLLHQTAGWEHLHGEFPGIALDIERLIFKDLITEIVVGEVATPQRRH